MKSAAIKDVALEDHACQLIRKALMWGLYSYGELQRISDYTSLRRTIGEAVDENVIPLDPIGRNDGLRIFAEALLLVSANDLTDD